MALSPNEELFHQASREGDLSKMKNILKKFINSKDDVGGTPLHNASNNGDTIHALKIFLFQMERK